MPLFSKPFATRPPGPVHLKSTPASLRPPHSSISSLPIHLFETILDFIDCRHSNIDSAIGEEFPYLPEAHLESWETCAATLAHICLVSTRWRSIAQPKLWEDVRIGDESTARLWIEGGNSRHLNTRRLTLGAWLKREKTICDVLQKDVKLRELVIYCDSSSIDINILGMPSLSC